MKKLVFLGLITLLATSAIVLAAPDRKGAPEFVPQLAEDKLSSVVFVRYAPDFKAIKSCNYDDVCDADEKWQFCSDCQKPGDSEEPTDPEPSPCYTFLSGSKPKWNWIEDYYYNDNGLGASAGLAATTWEDAASSDIFGNGLYEQYPWGTYDYFNSITYGDYPEQGVIGVTRIWFRGKNIYEYDIMYDTDYFPGDGSIDLGTVVLHEMGHAAGLGDLYNTECVDQVMYGYYEGVKHDLRSGDMAGIQTLYGA